MVNNGPSTLQTETPQDPDEFDLNYTAMWQNQGKPGSGKPGMGKRGGERVPRKGVQEKENASGAGPRDTK